MASNVEGKFQYLIETKELIKTAIQAKGQTVSDSDPFRSYADKIQAIEQSVESPDLRYVTFKNGSTTVYTKPVAVGDDCVDVLAKGLLTKTPTKASTAQYNYTYSGWSLTNGGNASSTALSNVTENRTVYAAFTSSVRSYTITYYDSDGTTVLTTQTLYYGVTPSYTPKKDGYVFEGWTVTPVAVAGNASYTAKWSVAPAFSTMTWAEISEASANGTASTLFKIGDTKEVVIGGTTHTVVIADLNHDDLADGSGKAGLSIVLRNALDTTSAYTSSKTATTTTWEQSLLRTNIQALIPSLPSDLQSVIKPVNKVSYIGTSSSEGNYNTTTDSLWPLSKKEFGLSMSHVKDEGTAYPLLAELPSGDLARSTRSGKKVGVWLRGRNSAWNRHADYISATGQMSGIASSAEQANIYFGFCV